MTSQVLWLLGSSRILTHSLIVGLLKNHRIRSTIPEFCNISSSMFILKWPSLSKFKSRWFPLPVLSTTKKVSKVHDKKKSLHVQKTTVYHVSSSCRTSRSLLLISIWTSVAQNTLKNNWNLDMLSLHPSNCGDTDLTYIHICWPNRMIQKAERFGTDSPPFSSCLGLVPRYQLPKAT